MSRLRFRSERGRQLTTFLAGGSIGFALDRVLKFLVTRENAGPVPLLGDAARFSVYFNDSMAFGIPLSIEWTRILSFVIFIAVLVLAIRAVVQSRWEAGALALVLIGALSNLIDRLAYGYVIDYVDIAKYSVFNLADVMIMSGVALLIMAKPHAHGQTDENRD